MTRAAWLDRLPLVICTISTPPRIDAFVVRNKTCDVYLA